MSLASALAPDCAVRTGARGDVYVVCAGADSALTAELVRALDGLRFRAVRAFDEAAGTHGDATRAIMASCVAVLALPELGAAGRRELEAARELGAAVALVAQGMPRGGEILLADGERLAAFLDAALLRSTPAPVPCAFLAVRIHDDFALVRQAIASAVERELGIPCVYFDDPRVCGQRGGVRERTRQLIRTSALFIADLTFGPDNLGADSPNTAHEIGTALAYERPVLVTCQLPRRDLYFAAGDLDALFWHDERDLALRLAELLRPLRATLGRRVLNYELAAGDPKLPRPAFEMPAKGGYRAPNARLLTRFEVAACAAGVAGVVAFLSAALATRLDSRAAPAVAAGAALAAWAAGMSTRLLQAWALRWAPMPWAVAVAGAGALCALTALLAS